MTSGVGAMLWCVCAAAAPALSGQVVQGRVLEAGSERPVPAALVTLEDESGERLARVLTDEAGRFRIVQLLPGSFRLLAQHIGHASVRSELFDLGLGERRSLTLVAEIKPLRLRGLTAEPDRRCRTIDATDAGIISSFWEEASKALDAAAWTAESSELAYAVTHYERLRNPDDLDVVEEKSTEREGVGAQPFRSLSAAELHDGGYVRGDDAEGRVYLAPDAAALLAPSFLNNHCFRFHDDRHWADSVGIEFRPLQEREVVDIRGVFWLDGSSFKLRRVEYRYTGLDIGVPTGKLGGRIEFEELATGAWIVRDWYIRMPQIREVRSRRRARRELIGIMEVGGYVVTVTDPTGRSLRRVHTPSSRAVTP